LVHRFRSAGAPAALVSACLALLTACPSAAPEGDGGASTSATASSSSGPSASTGSAGPAVGGGGAGGEATSTSAPGGGGVGGTAGSGGGGGLSGPGGDGPGGGGSGGAESGGGGSGGGVLANDCTADDATDLLTIDPDGDGPLLPREVACDLAFDGGGWTMIQSYTAGNGGPWGLFGGIDGAGEPIDVDPIPGDGHAALPGDVVQALANGATQVHIRTHFDAGVDPRTGNGGQWITSRVEASKVIENLRDLHVINRGLWDEGDSPQTFFTGSSGERARLWYKPGYCDPLIEELGLYPAIYWACGNELGLHIYQSEAAWNRDDTVNDAIEVWVR
jgi:hypothetical protein